MANNKKIECTFCNKNRKQVDTMIEGPVINELALYICNSCVSELHGLIEATTKPKSQKNKLMPPSEIRKHLDQFIIGQVAAKKAISIAIYNHYKRVNDIGVSDTKLQKSNVMVIGPSGTGKTLIASTVADIMNLPFAIGDATTLTEAGYVGDGVENLIKRLVQSANGNVAKAEHGVVFIDEIDKKRRRSESSSTKDVSGEGVQQALLKLVEGTIVKIEHNQNEVEVNTENILFICGGAFVGLSEIVKKNRQGKSTMGFGADINDTNTDSDLYLSASSDDLIGYGMIPEFVGRFPVLVTLENLTESDMESILKEPKNSIVEQYTRLFEIDGVGLLFADKYIKNVAQKGFTQKTGARGLRSIIEQDLSSIQYDLPDLATQGYRYVYVQDDGTIKTTKRKIVNKKQTHKKEI